MQSQLAAVKIQDSELGKLQDKQRAAVQRSLGRASAHVPNGTEKATSDDDGDEDGYSPRSSYVHPDLQDLNFGDFGTEKRNLPPPMRPSAPVVRGDSWRRGSLSDFSDYESSDEETHAHVPASAPASMSTYPRNRAYGHASSDDDAADPFADPFADQDDDENENEHDPGVSTPGIPQRQVRW